MDHSLWRLFLNSVIAPGIVKLFCPMRPCSSRDISQSSTFWNCESLLSIYKSVSISPFHMEPCQRSRVSITAAHSFCFPCWLSLQIFLLTWCIKQELCVIHKKLRVLHKNFVINVFTFFPFNFFNFVAQVVSDEPVKVKHVRQTPCLMW